MRALSALFVLFLCLFSLPRGADAKVQVSIDLSAQKMRVSSSTGEYTWPISSARSGYVTPRGSYEPYLLQKMHYSRKYHMSPMPHSIFFHGGYAIHGTSSVRQLGRPASHGCIRLAPTQAAQLFKMVKAEGAAISISGTPPQRAYAKVQRKKTAPVYAKIHRQQPAYGAVRYAAPQPTYGAQPVIYAPWGGASDAGLAYAPVRQAPSVKAWQVDPRYR
jgi:hypothetical protein